MRLRPTITVPVLLSASLLLTACSDAGSSADGGDGPLAGAELTVGSKSFAESIILSYMAMAVLEDAGATVQDETGIESSANVRTALTSGDIDLYWEYTGTGWISYLGETEPLDDAQEQFDAVAEADLEENSIAWLARSPINNAYAIAANTQTAEELGVSTMSDLGTLLAEDPDALTMCVESEFAARDDGLPGVLEAYDLQSLPEENISTVGEAIIYTELRDGGTCNFGEVFATDARISAFGLTVLEDDRTFFPIYNASPTVRAETDENYPEIAELLTPIAEALDNETMAALNAEVDLEGRTAEDVAEEWLTEKGFLD
ncbi:glycine betaine ABC transporter substrate-binding protein [Ruania alba]|uniref:Osmoprotectant transport system substrate-binding protein n=1 Tax=Ruania alba TaxID=648782 RepID=A0A1H5GPF7_9MICO|nr:glycine betaine ABC transporter substrate-binding protein [Ruania alba]SEE17490.1 osmoprotectant transport system substrate-binding protein [Ruania alba]